MCAVSRGTYAFIFIAIIYFNNTKFTQGFIFERNTIKNAKCRKRSTSLTFSRSHSKEGPDSNQNISLVYTNSDEHSHSEEVAKFTVPKLTKKWSKIVIKVSTSNITFYLNCHEMARQRVTRIPQELVFDTASTLYIAQAGPHIQERYDVSTPFAYSFIQKNKN